MEDEDAEMAKAMATSEREYVRQGVELSPPKGPGTNNTGGSKLLCLVSKLHVPNSRTVHVDL